MYNSKITVTIVEYILVTLKNGSPVSETKTITLPKKRSNGAVATILKRLYKDTENLIGVTPVKTEYKSQAFSIPFEEIQKYFVEEAEHSTKEDSTEASKA
jgi:hypothetical protein